MFLCASLIVFAGARLQPKPFPTSNDPCGCGRLVRVARRAQVSVQALRPRIDRRIPQKGDWCKEHDLPESHCVECDPELKAKLAAIKAQASAK